MPLGYGVFAVERKGRPAQIECRQWPTLREKLDEDLLVGIVMALNASERLTSLVHMMTLLDPLGKKSLAFQRNNHAASALVFATLHEAMSALEDLRRAGISGLEGFESAAWDRLDKMRKHWRKEPFLERMRHALGHHLGREEIRAGLRKIPHGERIAFFRIRGESRFEMDCPIALRSLLLGLGMDQKDFERHAGLAVEHACAYPGDVELVLFEVLRCHGITFKSEREWRDDEIAYQEASDGGIGTRPLRSASSPRTR